MGGPAWPALPLKYRYIARGHYPRKRFLSPLFCNGPQSNQRASLQHVLFQWPVRCALSGLANLPTCSQETMTQALGSDAQRHQHTTPRRRRTQTRRRRRRRRQRRWASAGVVVATKARLDTPAKLRTCVPALARTYVRTTAITAVPRIRKDLTLATRRLVMVSPFTPGAARLIYVGARGQAALSRSARSAD